MFAKGITATSLAAIVFGMFLMGMLIQHFEVNVSSAFLAEHALAVPAIMVIVLISLLAGTFRLVGRWQLLSKPEMLCILFALLLAAPLMTQGFWHRIVAITATIPRMGDFEKMDAFSDRLWPHGPNLLDGSLTPDAPAARLRAFGNVAWETVEYDQDREARIPVLTNLGATDRSGIRFYLPVQTETGGELVRGEPYMISVLLRPDDLGPGAFYYGRLLADDATDYDEFFRDSAPARITFAQKRGFQRTGVYGIRIPQHIAGRAVVEFGLSGPGRLALTDPKLFSVAALETAFTGKQMILESEYRALPPADRANLIVRPDNLWSLKGLGFVLAAYVPWGDWLMPLAVWSSLILLILLATLCVNVIMRRQWTENERYPLPLTRISHALLGSTDADALRPRQIMPAIWKNGMMWLGFVLASLWIALRVWSFYNPRVPNLAVAVDLQPYFAGPEWGGMWDGVTFRIHAVFLALAVLMELNVLLSLVLGMFLFRCLYRVGEFTGWQAHTGYPFPEQQVIAGYIVYALLIVVFARKYLWGVLKAAFRGDAAASAGEAMSYRAALSLLVLCFVGAAAWGRWVAVSPAAMALYFLFIVITGLVASKFRAECGAPFGYFQPARAWLFITLIGGFSVFESSGVLVCLVISFMVFESVFFLMPGAQLETLEMGRQYKVIPRHLLYTCLLGVAGGMLVGGWVFLSNAYALGGDTARYTWAFETKFWYLNPYNAAMKEATATFLGEQTGSAPAGLTPETWAYLFAGAVTLALTLLRQLFAGFWFHPFGFILGSSWMHTYIWGSLLTAWAIRLIVLRLGGAATVRTKLIPFFIGVFLAGVAAYLLLGLHGSHLLAQNVERIFSEVP